MTLYQTAPRRSSCVELQRSNGALEPIPVDFDAEACPIIARHWFGIPPLCPTGEVAAEVISGLKPRRIEHYNRLGPRTCGAVLPLAEARAGP